MSKRVATTVAALLLIPTSLSGQPALDRVVEECPFSALRSDDFRRYEKQYAQVLLSTLPTKNLTDIPDTGLHPVPKTPS